MERKGGPGTRSLMVPLGAVIALLLALGIVVLAVHAGKSPSNTGASGEPSPSASTPAPGVLPGLPAQPTTPPASPAPSAQPSPGAASANPGAPPGAGGLPNTGGPFPWWLGLLPISLGLGLMAALHRRPAAVGSVGAGYPGTVRARRSGAAGGRRRPPSTPRNRRP